MVEEKYTTTFLPIYYLFTFPDPTNPTRQGPTSEERLNNTSTLSADKPFVVPREYQSKWGRHKMPRSRPGQVECMPNEALTKAVNKNSLPGTGDGLPCSFCLVGANSEALTEGGFLFQLHSLSHVNKLEHCP